MKPAIRAPIVRLLTLPEAAARLGLSNSAISRLIVDGVFEKLRVSVDGWRLRPDDVDAYALACVGNQPPPAAVRRAAGAPTRGGAPVVARAPLLGHPRLLAIRRLGITPSAPHRLRDGGPAANVPAAFLAFPDSARVQEYLRTCAQLAKSDLARARRTARPMPALVSGAMQSAGDHADDVRS